ncbi:MAG TPA: polyamine aminopropyltransferase [Rhizomicrobium sp.]|jgi:spermidine synthase
MTANWFVERAYGDIRPAYRVAAVLCRVRSRFQKIEILETTSCGRMLILDGTIQLTERDECIYHEMMAHVPLFAHGRARRVLIIGGGDGGILRETLKHNVEHVTMVEIDQRLIDECRRHLPRVSGNAFADPRVTLVIGDGASFVAKAQDKYDVIIVDSTDRVGPGRVLYTSTFYGNCSRVLASGGILVNQNGMAFLFPEHLKLTFQRRKPFFRDTSFYLATIPNFFGGALAFGWATNRSRPRQEFGTLLRERYTAARFETQYYSPAVHLCSFVLPPIILRHLS